MVSKVLISFIWISYLIFSQHYFHNSHALLTYSTFQNGYAVLDKIDFSIFTFGLLLIIVFSNFKELLLICILSILLYFIFYGIQYHNYISKLFHQWPESNFIQLQKRANTSFSLDLNESKILYLEIMDAGHFGSKCTAPPFILELDCPYSINCDGITVYARLGFIPKDLNTAIVHKKTPQEVTYFYDTVDFLNNWSQIYKSDRHMLYIPGLSCYQSGRYYFLVKNYGNISQQIQAKLGFFYCFHYEVSTYCENTNWILIVYIILILLATFFIHIWSWRRLFLHKWKQLET